MSFTSADFQLPAYSPIPFQYLIATSGLQTAATATATLPGIAGRTTYLTGFDFTGGGATAGSTVSLVVGSVAGGAPTFVITVPAGVTTAIPPLIVRWNTPISAVTTNSAITVSVPSLGAGNVGSCITAYGFLA